MISSQLISKVHWKKNDLFLSLPRINAIIHYRPSTNKVINFIQGPFSWQHDVDIISDHEISIFNNNNSLTDRNHSEITIYDFKTKKFSKKFNKSLIENNLKLILKVSQKFLMMDQC